MPAASAIAGQAAGLRRLGVPAGVRTIAVCSGKGGVGKTNVSVNLAISLARDGKEVVLMDADLGLGNVDVLLGLATPRNLSHVIDGHCSLEEALVTGPAGVRVLAAASGLRRMTELGDARHAALIRAFGASTLTPEVLIVDTAAGISGSVVSFTQAANDIVVVVCDEPSSITDAYALMKVLRRDRGRHRFRILANMVDSSSAGLALYQKLLKVSERFLDVSLAYMGAIPYDEHLPRAVRRQRAVVEAYPRSQAAGAFKKMASATDTWFMAEEPGGNLEFFVERLVPGGGGAMEAQA